jgi:hypothetical protein
MSAVSVSADHQPADKVILELPIEIATEYGRGNFNLFSFHREVGVMAEYLRRNYPGDTRKLTLSNEKKKLLRPQRGSPNSKCKWPLPVHPI